MTAVGVAMVGLGIIVAWSGIKGHDFRDVLYAAIKRQSLPDPPRYAR